MKNKLLFVGLIFTSLLYSCKTEFPDNVKKADLTNKSSYEAGINAILKKYDTNNALIAINKISVDNSASDAFVIVNFDTKNKKNMTFAVQREYDNQGLVGGETYIYCEGSCTSKEECGMNWSLTEPKYVECSCAGCKMIYTHTAPQNIVNNNNDGLILAKESYKKTFKTDNADDVIIKSIMFSDNEKIAIQEITYADGKGNKSTFVLVRAKVKGITADGVSLTENKDFVVDCTGSCDCRERFFPATGAVECTCSPCKMEVKEIKAPE